MPPPSESGIHDSTIGLSSLPAPRSAPPPLTRRTIDPLHLTRCEGQWYLIAYCHLRKQIRTFVPLRIQKVALMSTSFTPPAGFDPDDHFRTAFGIVSGFNVAEVRLRFDAEAAGLIRERRWHATQVLEELDDGEVRLRMTCSQSQELLSWLLSWGEHVRVESPAALAKEVREAHRRAAVAHASRLARPE